MLLFHGIYGRMYSLFLFTSLLSFLALLAATRWVDVAAGQRGSASPCSASRHTRTARSCSPPSAVYVAATRLRLREAALSLAIVLVLGIPFWRTDLVLAGRFEIGVGGGGGRLGSPLDVLRYLAETSGDFVAGYRLAIAAASLSRSSAPTGSRALGRGAPFLSERSCSPPRRC